MESDPDFLSIFLDEAEDTLQLWEADCLALSKISERHSLWQSIFRHAHNLKGSARSVGLENYAAFIHKAEDLITALRDEKIPFGAEAQSLLLDCQALLAEWAQDLRSDPNKLVFTGDLMSQLAALLGKTEVKPGTQTDPKKPAVEAFVTDPEAGDIIWASDCETQLPVSPQNLGRDPLVLKPVTKPPLEKKQTHLLGAEPPQSAEPSQNAEPPQNAKPSQNSDHQNPRPGSAKSSGAPQADETLRVPLAKIDALIRLSGELAIQSAILTNATRNSKETAGPATQAAALIAKAVSDLQTEAMSLRMQSVSGLFQRMERVLLDVASQLKKEVEVVVEGKDVELDKVVLELIKDPLVHILRNAIDHGIEPAEKRIAAGKSAKAQVRISAKQSASSVSIIISDDGQGLNKQKILAKAISKGLVDAKQEISEPEIYKLIFLPGFSTSDNITDISGRGVGMEVVKKAVDGIGGKIQIESVAGQGTEFQINIPSSLSIMDAIIITVQSNTYAVPIQDIEEVVHVNSLQKEMVSGQNQVVNLRGSIFPLKRLSDFLPNKDSIHELVDNPIAIVARFKSRTVAFEIDRIVGQQSIVVRKLDDKMKKVVGFSGGTILQNGEPGMIVHLPSVIEQISTQLSTQ